MKGPLMVAPADVAMPATQNTGLVRIDASEKLMTLCQSGETSLKFITDMGKTLADSRMLKLKNPQQGAAVILASICEGITPFQLMKEYHIMDDGGMSMKADVMLAKFNAAGGKHQWINTGDDGSEAVLRLIWGGQDIQVSYSIDDAKRAGLVRAKSNWEKDPGSMLRARATSKGVRMVMPGIVAGVYCPEDFDQTELPPATENGTSKRRQSTASTAASTASSPPKSAMESDEIIDAEVESKSSTEKPPFEASNSDQSTTQNGSEKSSDYHEFSTTLMEIEATIGQLGKTVADIVASMSAKNPEIKSLDDLTMSQAQQVLKNLRAALEKKRQQTVAAS